MKKWRFLSLALIFTILLSLVGCGGNGNNTSTNGGSVNSDGTGGGSAEQTETVITFAINVGNCKEQNPEYYYAIQAFMDQNPDVKIKLIENATEEHNAQMQLYASTSELPDIFWLFEGDAPLFQENGYLLPLNDFLDANPEISEAIADPIENAYRADDGSIYGLACSSLITGMYYNKAIFDECGVAYPTDETTYEDMLNMIEKFNEKGYVGIAQGALTNYSLWCWLGSFNRYGYSEQIDAVMAGDESFAVFKPLLEKFEEMGQKGAFPENYATIDYFEAKDLFKAGSAAMFNAGAWDAATVTESLGENTGFWWGPVFNDSDYSQATINQFANAPFVVSSSVGDDAAKKDAVYRFLQFFYGKEGATIMSNYSTFSIANYADMESDNEIVGFQEIIKAMGNGNASASAAQPVSSLPSSVSEVMYDSVQSLITGSIGVDDAISDVDAAIARQ